MASYMKFQEKAMTWLPNWKNDWRLGYLVTVRKQRSGLVEIQDIDVGAII